MVVKTLLTALAAASIAHGAQMSFLLAGGVGVPLSLSLSHWLLIVIFNLAVAALLANRLDNRLWAAALFMPPVAAALSFGAAFQQGRLGTVLFALSALTIVALWLFRPIRSGVPVVASCGGAILGAAISLYRTRPAWSAASDLSLFFLIALVLGVLGLTLLAAHRLHRLSIVSPRVALGLTILAAVLSLASLPRTVTSPDSAVLTTGDPDSPPIVLVVLDTLRADHLELHGYSRDTMPNLERFARQHAVVSTRSIANAAHSLPSHASMFTGLYPTHHGAHTPFVDDPKPRRFAYPLDPSIPTLATLLAAKGYWTVGVSANYGPLAPDFGLSQGFQAYSAVPSPRLELRQRSPWALDPGSRDGLQRILSVLDRLPPFSLQEFFLGPDYLRASQVTDRAIEVIEAAADRPFFLFLNYFDPHAPYYPPARFRDKFPGRDPALGPRGLRLSARQAVLSAGRDLTAAEYAHVTALYDGELAYLDAELGRLLKQLQQHPRWDEMLLILTSDHGEAFGEHRYLEHGTSLYNEQLWVPLIVKTSGEAGKTWRPGTLVQDLVQSVDLYPMVLTHAGVPVPPGGDGVGWEGRREQAPAWQFVEQSYLRYGEGRFRRELRAVTSDEWKLIASSQGQVELYDLRSDPQELLNVAPQHPDRVQLLTDTLEGTGPARRGDMAEGDDLSAETEKRLRALGYIN